MAKEVRIVVTGIRRKEPDFRKLARALIQLVLAENENEATELEAPPKREAAS